MQRLSIPAEVFGYLICLLATVIFFVSVAGIVNNTFRVVHPIPQQRMFGRHLRPGFGGMTAPPRAVMTLPSAADRDTIRARLIGDARYGAARRLILAIAMLILSIIVFTRTFAWLNPKHAVT
jgi:hypothetical protein